MKTLKTILKWGVIIFAVMLVLFYLVIAPNLGGGGPPQGNHYAILKCRLFLTVAKRASTNSPAFDYSKYSADQQLDLIKYAILGQKDCWIKTNFVWGSNSNREIVIVCERKFDEVPTGIWNSLWRHPAHAVGYSDGKTGQIRPSEYTNLDLSQFRHASKLASEWLVANPSTAPSK